MKAHPALFEGMEGEGEEGGEGRDGGDKKLKNIFPR